MPGVAEGYAQIFLAFFLFWNSGFTSMRQSQKIEEKKNLHPPPPAPILTVFSPPIMPGVAEGYAQIFLDFFLFWYSVLYLNAVITKKSKKIYTPPAGSNF